MDGQMTLFDWLYPDQLNPIREVAKIANPYWKESRQKLIELDKTDPDINTFAREVRKEYCPYGASGQFGLNHHKANELLGYDMRSNKIMVYFYNHERQKQTREYSWCDFAREIADLIWSNKYKNRGEQVKGDGGAE